MNYSKKTVLTRQGYEDGVYEISSGNGKEKMLLSEVAYTGWKMIGVIPESVQAANIKNFRYYIFTTVLVIDDAAFGETS